jgi:cytoskeletal protein CcmA (bactofilin family)
LATSASANKQSGSANKETGSILFTSASSLELSASALQTTASNLSTYTSSLQQAIQPNGVDLNVSGNLFVGGNIVAQNYIVSSSVTYMTTSFSSGSTVFGNDSSDTHQLTGSVYVTGAFNLKDVSSELSIVGNGFGQTSLISPNGALVLTPGLYGVQINGANPDLQVNGNITANGYISGAIRATNAVVSSSTQFVEYGALLTSSVSGKQAVSGTLIVSGTTLLTGSVGVDLRSGSEFYVRNGVTRIDSVLFVTDNDYVNSAYVGGDIRVNDYLAGGYTAHYDGGVQITGSLIVKAGQNGSGSYFTGSVWITGNEAVSGNLQVVGNSSVSGNFIGTTISASSAVTASSLRVEGLTRVNGDVDLDSTKITIGAGGNADADETRLNTLNLRVDSDAFFNSNITAISGSTRFKSVAINDLSESRIPYVDSTDTLTDNANFTYNGVVFKIGGGRFEVDDSTGNIRTSGSLSVGALNISNNLNVAGAVGIESTLTVTGSTLISSSLRATSTASFGALTITGSTILSNRLQVGTNAAISGTLRVSGAAALSSSLFVSGNITAGANANIAGDVAIIGSLSALGPTIAFGNSLVDRTIISGALELNGSLTRNTTNLKAAFSQVSTYTQEQAWSASFVSESTLRPPDEYLEYFVGQGSNKRRYITPVWLDETLYADDYFDISVTVGADSDYVF